MEHVETIERAILMVETDRQVGLKIHKVYSLLMGGKGVGEMRAQSLKVPYREIE